MDTFPDQNFRGGTATISLKADSHDYETLKILSKKAGLGQSNMLHLLLEMMRLRVLAERSRANVVVDMFGSDLEAFIWLTAQDSGLIADGEVLSGAWAIHNTSGGSTFKDRQDGLFELLQRRFNERYGSVSHWELDGLFGVEPAEQVDDNHPARLAAEISEQTNTNTDALAQ